MNCGPFRPPLLAVLAAAAAFIWLSGNALPPLVASHFTAGGTANGFMPRSAYLGFMLAVAIGLPLLQVLILGLIHRLPERFISLPDRDYWLAPERRRDTLDYLGRQGDRFAMLLCAFLCFVHWLVMRANAQQPPHFPEATLFAALPWFAIALLIWIGAFFVRFLRRPST